MFNLWLKIKNLYRYWFDITKEGTDLDYSKLSEVTKLSHHNITKTFVWDNLGYHPENLEQWYNRECVRITDNIFYIDSRFEPKTFPNGIYIKYAVGVAISKRLVNVNEYVECEIFIPKANGQWFAFWLSGSVKWPPEIDIVEGYSRRDNYKDYKKFQPNLHYRKGDGLKKKSIGAVDRPLPKTLKGRFVKFGLLWKKDRIEWYYNGYLVKVLTNKNILLYMNEPLRLKINSGIQAVYNPQDTTTIFKNIKIYRIG